MLDSPHWLTWLEWAGCCVVDVHTWSDVRIVGLDDARNRRVLLGGREIEEFDAVVSIGTPGSVIIPNLPLRDLWYCNAERNSALLAALAMANRPAVLNRGYVLLWNRQLADPIAMLRRLAAHGWCVGAVASVFRSGTDDVAIAPRRDPEPEFGSKRLAVFASSGACVMADDPDGSVPNDVWTMRPAMQSMLCTAGLDWLTVSVGVHRGTTFAYGARAELPRSLSAAAAARLIQSCLTAQVGGRVPADG